MSEVVREDGDTALARWVGAKQGDAANIHDVLSSAAHSDEAGLDSDLKPAGVPI